MAARHRSATAYATLVLLAVAFVAAVIASNTWLRGFRLDLTENGLYTLSDGTRSLLEGVDEPINLYFFFSGEQAEGYPTLRGYAMRVREMLEELSTAAGGSLTLHEVDPAPFSEDEDRAAAFGLRDLNSGLGDSFYFGLAATNSVGEEAVIAEFDPTKESSLEYDLARLIYSLATADKTVVGVLSGAPIAGGFDPQRQQPTQAWIVLEQMRQLFDVRMLQPTATRFDADVDVLWIVHPTGLDEPTLYAIDQFVLGGGRAAVFVDPYAEILTGAGPQSVMSGAPSSSLEPLLSAWGIELDTSKFVADDGHALSFDPGAGRRPVRHIGLLGLRSEAMAGADVVTADLPLLHLWTAGALIPSEDMTAAFEPLLSSSTEAALLDTSRLTQMTDPAALLDGFAPTGQRYTLAARLSGPLGTAFPGGPPAGLGEDGEAGADSQTSGAAATSADGANAEASAGGADGAAEGPPDAGSNRASAPDAHIAETENANLIVVADVDVLSDPLWVQARRGLLGGEVLTAFASNGDFVGNALANLGGSADLIGLERRGTFSRPFERVQELRREADARFREKEQQLQAELEETERRLTELATAREETGSLLMTPEQSAELERFRNEQLRIRQELRAVRRDLDRSIERLGTVLEIVNIAAVPVAVVLVALAVALLRRRRGRGRGSSA